MLNVFSRFLLVFSTAFVLSPSPLYAQKSITPEWLWSLGRVSEPKVSPDGSMVLFGVAYYSMADNKGNRDLYTIPVGGGTAQRVASTPFSENQAVWKPGKRIIGYLSSESGTPQLWEINPDGTGKTQITNVAGGILGFKYSPNGKALCYAASVKLDTLLLDRYPDLPKANAQLFDALMYRHWDSWADGTYQHLFYTTLPASGQVTSGKDLMQGERYHCPTMPFGGMEDMAWHPDGTSIVYVSKKKTGTQAATSTDTELYLYKLESGSTEKLTGGAPGYDVLPAFSPDGRRLAWLSMARDGFEADKEVVMMHTLSTGKTIALTSTFYEGFQSMSWDASGNTLWCTAVDSGTKQVYAVDATSGRVKQVTYGIHDVQEVEQAGSFLVASRSTMLSPTELVRIRKDNGTLTPLTAVNKAALEGIAMPAVERRLIPTTDGKRMLTWVILPPSFDQSKRYPALLYCQGGPQSPVSQFFSYRWNFALMASKGYVVVAPNRRGLPGFGREWNDAICGDWGGQAIQDYYAAIDQVASEPYIDRNKLCAAGASYGGYSVFQMAGTHEKRFKAFIAHCGIFNLESWYGSTEEVFFGNWDMKGPYWEQPAPKSYAQFSPHRFVHRWDTPILILHGDKDYRVPVTQGMEAFQAAQLQGVPSRFVHFPEENHWILKPQNSILWNRVFFEWLEQWVGE